MNLYRLIPIPLQVANAIVAHWHRHHKPVRGHKFSIALLDRAYIIRGVAIVGRPVSRGTPADKVLEVTRCCTDGSKNACSALYAAAARVADALGYERIQTYTLDTEPGTSLLAAGWRLVARTRGGLWKRNDGIRCTNTCPPGPKNRWERILNPPTEPYTVPQATTTMPTDTQLDAPDLFKAQSP